MCVCVCVCKCVCLCPRARARAHVLVSACTCVQANARKSARIERTRVRYSERKGKNVKTLEDALCCIVLQCVAVCRSVAMKTWRRRTLELPEGAKAVRVGTHTSMQHVVIDSRFDLAREVA